MLTKDELQKVVTYDKETGAFTWNTQAGCRNAGDKCGGVDPNGYSRFTINKKLYTAHRLAWLYVYGEMPSGDIDHINGIKSDNRIANLRVVSKSGNAQNRAARKDNVIGFAGVTFRKSYNKWVARIEAAGRRMQIGSFSTPEEAHSAYVKAKLSMHEFFSEERVQDQKLQRSST